MTDVYEEVSKLMTRSKVGMHRIMPCSWKYAFGRPGIPKEAEYLKLLYSYDKPALRIDLKGETFFHVFGTNIALTEHFVMWKNIMGPWWLKIDGEDFTAVKNASWCKLELQVDRPDKNICTLGDTDNLDAPPLTLMSLALRTTMNTKENKNEIHVANVRLYENISLTNNTPPEMLRRDQSRFVGKVAKHHSSMISMERNEAAVLSKHLAIVQKYHPDTIMGHKLDDVDYNTLLTRLLTRLDERKTPYWHRIGRLKRGDWPKNVGKGGGSFFVERHLAAGRLLCDIANDMGKS
ncbi:DNA-directed DNA polymerase alpha catalytic subunit pol1 [Oleoguttula sp. CCFEE 5521]